MRKRFTNQLDRRAKIVTLMTITALATILGIAIFISLGSYVSAWLFALFISIILICALSIPRHIDVSDDCVEICCIMELTVINIEDVSRVRTIQTEDMQKCIPIWGSFGFFGYFGYFFNFRTMELIKMYARSWGNFVEIMDSFGQKYIVSCANPQELVDIITENRAKFLAK